MNTVPDDLLPGPDPIALAPTSNAPWYDRFISRNAKALAAAVIAGLGWAAVVVHSPSHAITADEWLQLGTAAATAIGVYGATNKPAL